MSNSKSIEELDKEINELTKIRDGLINQKESNKYLLFKWLKGCSASLRIDENNNWIYTLFIEPKLDNNNDLKIETEVSKELFIFKDKDCAPIFMTKSRHAILELIKEFDIRVECNMLAYLDLLKTIEKINERS